VDRGKSRKIDRSPPFPGRDDGVFFSAVGRLHRYRGAHLEKKDCDEGEVTTSAFPGRRDFGWLWKGCRPWRFLGGT